MRFYLKWSWMLFLALSLSHWPAHATVDGSLSGSVVDDNGVAVSGAKITVKGDGGEKDLVSSPTGAFQVFPLTLGEYQVSVSAEGFSSYQTTVEVTTDAVPLDIHLIAAGANGEMRMTVKAKRHLITTSSTSSKELDQAAIAQLPGGGTASLPRLLYTTNPGMVEGPFGQVFTRGNHANLQYQIDGIQLPDSVSGSFGEAFTPLNIDHMEIITGGLQPEYGTRLAGVVNIVTKSGTLEPGGELGLSYGTYNQTSPFLTYGGSDSTGEFHYFLSANGLYTDRGLDTPNPASPTDDSQGGSEAVHDQSYGAGQFGKFDWQVDNTNKLSLVAFNEQKNFQIPDYPSSFTSSSPFFNTYTDPEGNGPFAYVPSWTNDSQFESTQYAEFAWNHSFDANSFIQVSPYWKRSNSAFTNDPTSDLAPAYAYAGTSQGVADTFTQNRVSENLGVQADYTLHADANNMVKAGVQMLWTQSTGPVSITYVDDTTGSPVTTSSADDSTDNGYQEGIYLQDDLTLAKWLVVNGGLRYDATQFVFPETTTTDGLLQPRIGVNFLAGDFTKFHLFYGKMFMPAPAEDLRDAFNTLGTGQLTPYDIKAEKDDYFEAGMAQQVGNQLLSLNVYYKAATNMLDDTQLLNTAISQPFNFATGYADGVEFSMNGQLGGQWSDFANYSYEIAKGQGINGGIFAFPAGTDFEPGIYQFLDHCQIHTASAGLTYNPGDIWVTVEGLFGGGLSTGPNNSLRLPAHFTMDTTLGYAFKKDSGFSGMKVSLDALNLFDDPYPVFIANGFNGNHYEAGREFIFRLTEKL